MGRLFGPRWLLVHAGALVVVVGFLLLGWWQVGRAASGNMISYGYAVQWPAFAAFVVYVWIKEIRRALAGPVGSESVTAATALAGESSTEGVAVAAPRTTRAPAIAGSAYDDSDDPALAAYNHYLAWLAAHPHASPAAYPGRTETPGHANH